MKGYQQIMGRWTGLGAANMTQAGDTPIVALAAPMRGAITHVTTLSVLPGSTQHTLWLLRPLNYTTLSADAAASQAVVNLTDNPGTYTTNYKYALGPSNYVDGPLGAPATLPTFQTANLTLAANQYLVFETPDGAFYFDYIASVATLAVTMTSVLPVGLKAGARVWLMGTTATNDPATASKQWNYLDTASTAFTLQGTGWAGDILATLHPYDPILFYDANATAADTILRFEGYYAKW